MPPTTNLGVDKVPAAASGPRATQNNLDAALEVLRSQLEIEASETKGALLAGQWYLRPI